MYAEGINLHERDREQEAAALFEKAIAVDPAFAMAYAKLAVTENNLGHLDRRDKYAAAALKLKAGFILSLYASQTACRNRCSMN